MLYLAIFLFISQVFGDVLECLQSLDCKQEDLEYDGTIRCGGYRSCYYSTINATIIECPGQGGCAGGRITEADDLRCYGAYGCSSTVTTEDSLSGQYNEQGYHCASLRSCWNSVMYAPFLKAQGYLALQNSDVYATDHSSGYTYFYIEGDRSSFYTTFYSNSVDQVWIYFRGFRSGSTATVYCEGGSYCYINCLEEACVGGLTIEVDSSSSYTLVCADGTSDCATVTSSSVVGGRSISKKNKKIKKNNKKQILVEDPAEYEIFDESLEDDEIRADSWSTTSWTYCEYESNCTDAVQSGFYGVSCAGYQSCDSADYSDWSYFVFCWGYYGGKEATLSDASNMQCHGYKSCEGMTVDTVTNVYVSGYGGLDYGTINDASYIVSSTAKSMTQATINALHTDLLLVSRAQNFEGATINVKGQDAVIKFEGYYSGTNAKIYCRDGAFCDVYCGNYDCSNTQLWVEEDADYNLTCSSSSSDFCATVYVLTTFEPTMEPTASPTLWNETCNSTNQCVGTVSADYIICDGGYSCNGATLDASILVKCIGSGNRACYGSTITSDEVRCLGTEKGCQTATITGGDVICGTSHYPPRICKHSSITLDEDGSTLTCSSFSGIEGGSVYVKDNVGTATINALASGTFNYATIDAGEGNTVNIYGEGAYTLSYLSVTCGSGSTCNIYCNGAKACQEFGGCSGDGTCNIIGDCTGNCDSQSKSAKFVSFIKNNSNLYAFVGIIMSVVFISSFCYCNKDKLNNRWNYEAIPDSPDM